uniref:ATP synthase F0 subunit 8 n=2 Tax=Evacanthus TaxID=139554 RepID=A0A6N0A339_9HEMI|nr:ATP synthase F0 subunit 8 [Evacanthus acuminatus]QWC53809.1 ATP synthase F0 subunit 8 [Evacanthus heimianus]
MPQMSPMWWLNMMLMFIFCMMIMNSMIYFNFYYVKSTYNNYKNMNFNWKW